MALPCFVTNCGEGLDYRAMGSIFSGLTQVGAWGCFDEVRGVNGGGCFLSRTPTCAPPCTVQPHQQCVCRCTDELWHPYLSSNSAITTRNHCTHPTPYPSSAVEVLSVVSAQIRAIQNALNYGKDTVDIGRGTEIRVNKKGALS